MCSSKVQKLLIIHSKKSILQILIFQENAKLMPWHYVNYLINVKMQPLTNSDAK